MMHWTQLVVSLVNSLAWPAVVLLIVFWLRRPLIEKLSQLARVRGKSFEALFTEAKESGTGLVLATVRELAAPATSQPHEEPPYAERRDDIESMAAAPGELIAWAWGEAHLELAAAMRRLGLRPTWPGANLVKLRSRGHLDDQTYHTLAQMRKLFKAMYHGQTGLKEPTAAQATEYWRWAQDCIGVLRRVRRD